MDMMGRRSRSPGVASDTISSMSSSMRRRPPPDLATSSTNPAPLIPNLVMDPAPLPVRVDETVLEPNYESAGMTGQRVVEATHATEQADRASEGVARTGAARATEQADRASEVVARTGAVSEGPGAEGQDSINAPAAGSGAEIPGSRIENVGQGRKRSEEGSQRREAVRAAVATSSGIPPRPASSGSDRASSRELVPAVRTGTSTPAARGRESARSDEQDERLTGLLESMAHAITVMGDRLSDLEERRSVSGRSRQSSIVSRESSLLRAQLEGMRIGVPGGLPVNDPTGNSMMSMMGYFPPPAPPAGAGVSAFSVGAPVGPQLALDAQAYSPWVSRGVPRNESQVQSEVITHHIGTPRPADLERFDQHSGDGSFASIELTETPEGMGSNPEEPTPPGPFPTVQGSTPFVQGFPGPSSMFPVTAMGNFTGPPNVGVSMGQGWGPAYMGPYHMYPPPPQGYPCMGVPMVGYGPAAGVVPQPPQPPLPLPPPPVPCVPEALPHPPVGTPPITPRQEQARVRFESLGAFTPGGTPVPPEKGEKSNLESRDWEHHKHLPPERLEKYVPDLPVLQVTNVDASSVLSDWLIEASPVISSLSPGAGQWWRRVVAQAEEAYEGWLAASPTQRLHLVPDSDGEEYRCGKYSLLEQRVVTMVLKSFPEVIKQEALNARTVSTTALLFRAFCKIQPGSAADKQAMITFIVNPPVAQDVPSALDSYRKWVRVCRRLTQVRAQLPDPSLRLNGVDSIGRSILIGLQGTSFRVQTWREQNKVDYMPTHEKVDQLTQLLIAELELASFHAPTEGKAQPPKKPRVNKLQEDTSPPEPQTGSPPNPKQPSKGQGKEGKGHKGKTPKGGSKGESSAQAPANPQGSDSPLCKGYLTAKGCAYGDNCRMRHDFASAGRQSLCYACGSLDNVHRRPECPTVLNPKGSPKGKGKSKGGKAPPQAKAATLVETPGPVLTEVPERSEDATSVPSVAKATAPSSSHSALEQEALKILKGLRLSSISLTSEQGSSSLSREGGSPSFSAASAASVAFPLRGSEGPEGPMLAGLCFSDSVQGRVERCLGLIKKVGSDGALGFGGAADPTRPSENVSDGSGVDVRVFTIEGLRCVDGISVSEGVLDSGATHVFRWSSSEEHLQTETVDVCLPTGFAPMKISTSGSLLTLDTVPSVIPLQKSVELLGMQLQWDHEGPRVWHPRQGLLSVRVWEGRMVLATRDTKMVIQELEIAHRLLGLAQEWDEVVSLKMLNQGGSQDTGFGVSLRYVKSDDQGMALVDGGATNSLRRGTPQELGKASPISVELATGKANLKITEGGTLLTEQEVTMIVPLGRLIQELACSLSWDSHGCVITHPTRGDLPVVLRKGCPMIPERLAKELIDDLERAAYRRQIRIKALTMLEGKVWEPQSLEQLLSRANGDPEAEAVALMMYGKHLFPELSDELLEAVIPTGVSEIEAVDYQNSGLNRRVRRKIQKAQRVLVHLFSGVQAWKGTSEEVVLEVEKEKGRDLLNDSLFRYLLRAIISGKVQGIVGGPPCTTLSRARSRSDGPRVLRARQGPQRFGFSHLTDQEWTQVFRDNTLILRMLFLMHVAQEVTHNSCFLAIEHPRDPMLVDGAGQGVARLSGRDTKRGHPDTQLPSLWQWPEVQGLNLMMAQCDQGRLGHQRVKPTTIATNSWTLYESLHDLVVKPEERWVVDDLEGWTLKERIRSTRQAAVWAPGLVRAIQAAWRVWVSEGVSGVSHGIHRLQELVTAMQDEGKDVTMLRQLCQRLEEQEASQVCKLTPVELAFKKHVECGHVPWRNDCRTCVYGAAFKSPCRRKKFPHMYTLSVDLTGPFKTGLDYTGKAKYMLVGVYTYPKFWKNGHPVEPPVDESVPPGDLFEPPIPNEPIPNAPEDHPIPEEFDFDDGHEDGSPDGPDEREIDYVNRGEAKWRAITAANLSPLPALHVPYVVPLFRKTRKSVLQGIQQIYLALKRRGMPVQRIHSDRGREFINVGVRSWALARDIIQTATPAERPAGNGLCERFIGLLKAQSRALLHQAKLPLEYWPFAMRYSADCRQRLVFSHLGEAYKAPWPFGSQVVVQSRSWTRKSWQPRGRSATVLCAAPDVSKGWVVVANHENGARSFLITTLCYAKVKDVPVPEVEQTDPSPAAVIEPPVEHADGVAPDLSSIPEPKVPEVKRRITGKRALRCTQGGVLLSLNLGSSVDAKGPSGLVQGSGEGVSSNENVGFGSYVGRIGVEGSPEVRWFAERGLKIEDESASLSGSDRVEVRAGQLLQQSGELQCEQIRELVGWCNWPNQRQVRKVQKDTGPFVVFGAYSFGGCHGITRLTYQRRSLVQLLNRYVGQVAPSARYSALAISEGATLGWHRDCHNLSGSRNWVIPLGSFQGGEIRVLMEGQRQDEADLSEHVGFRLDVAQGPVSFDARRRHCVLPFTGDRVVLIGYTPRGFARLSRDQIQDLQEVLFPLPTPDAWELRAMLHEADGFSSGDDVGPEGGEESASEGDGVGEVGDHEVSQGPGI